MENGHGGSVRIFGRIVFALVFAVGLVVVAAVVAELAIQGTARLSRLVIGKKANFRYPAEMEVFRGKEWAPRYWVEEHESAVMEWAPYVMWRRKPYAGSVINVGPDRNRATWRPEAGAGATRPLRVWMFGGSALWGSGSPDDETIPSQLAKILAAEGMPAEVTNCGETGFVTTQEVVFLLRMLAAGPEPDLVIFYDGYNDVFCSYQQRTPGLTSNEHNRRFEFNVRAKPRVLAGSLADWYFPHLAELWSRARRGWAALSGRAPAPTGAAEEYYPLSHRFLPLTEEETVALADGTVATYRENLRFAEELCRARGIGFAAFWQPWLADKKRLTGEEQEIADRIETIYPDSTAFFAMVMDKLRQDPVAGTSYFRDLSGIFADAPEGYFYDQVHITGEGNRVVAGAIAQDVIPLLRKRNDGETR